MTRLPAAAWRANRRLAERYELLRATLEAAWLEGGARTWYDRLMATVAEQGTSPETETPAAPGDPPGETVAPAHEPEPAPQPSPEPAEPAPVETDGDPERDAGPEADPSPDPGTEPAPQGANKLVFQCKNCGSWNDLIRDDPAMAVPAASPFFNACGTCNGVGKVDTGSLVPGKGVLDCPSCNGDGYLRSADAPAPPVARFPEPPGGGPEGMRWNGDTGVWEWPT